MLIDPERAVDGEIGSNTGEERTNTLFHLPRNGAVTLQRDLGHFGELDAVLLLERCQRITSHIHELRARRW